MKYKVHFFFANRFIDKFMAAADFGEDKTYIKEERVFSFEYVGNTENILDDLLKVKNKLNENKEYEVVHFYLLNDESVCWTKEGITEISYKGRCYYKS